MCTVGVLGIVSVVFAGCLYGPLSIQSLRRDTIDEVGKVFRTIPYSDFSVPEFGSV